MKSIFLSFAILMLLVPPALADDKDKDRPPTYSDISLQISKDADALTEVHPAVQPFIRADVSGLKPVDDSAAAKQSADLSAKYDISETALKVSMPLWEKSQDGPISDSDYKTFLKDLAHTGSNQLPDDTIRHIYDKEAENTSPTTSPGAGGDGSHPGATDDDTDPRVLALGRFIKTIDDTKKFLKGGVDALAPLLSSPSTNTPTPPSPTPSNFSMNPYMPTPFGYLGAPPPGQGGGKSGGGGGGPGGGGSSAGAPAGGGAGAPSASVNSQLAASRSGENDNNQALGGATGGGVGKAGGLPPQATQVSNFRPGTPIADNAALYNPESILDGKPAFRYAREGGFALGKELGSDTGQSGLSGTTATQTAKKSTGGGRTSSVYNGKNPAPAKPDSNLFKLAGAYPPFEAPFNFNRDSGFANGAAAAVGDTITTSDGGAGGAGGKKGARLIGALQNQVLTTPPEDSDGHRWLLSYVGFTRQMCNQSEFSLPICPSQSARVAAPKEAPRALAIQTNGPGAFRAPASVWR